MPRHASLHPIKKKDEVEFVEDWTELMDALREISEAEEDIGRYVDGTAVLEDLFAGALTTVRKYVPKLIGQYTELWGISSALMTAWEDLQRSKDSLYVPDAQELIGGMK